MDLSNRVALVTGGAKRIGRAISFGLAREGVNIVFQYNQSRDMAEKTLADLRSLGVDVLSLQADFSRVSDIKKVVDKTYQKFKRIDILINNAAVYFKTPFGETTEKQWETLMHINFKAPFFCTQFVSSVMKKQKHGKIINIADVAGISPWPGFIPYSASKAGLISITKGLAKALAPDIQVNAIASGTVLMNENATKKFENEIKNLSLLKKIGTPSDIVNTVIFLLKGSDFITGEVIAVDGGRLLI